MDMGMIGKITSPCVQDTDHGNAASQEFGVHGQFFQSFGRSREEQIIDVLSDWTGQDREVPQAG